MCQQKGNNWLQDHVLLDNLHETDFAVINHLCNSYYSMIWMEELYFKSFKQTDNFQALTAYFELFQVQNQRVIQKCYFI